MAMRPSTSTAETRSSSAHSRARYSRQRATSAGSGLLAGGAQRATAAT